MKRDKVPGRKRSLTDRRRHSTAQEASKRGEFYAKTHLEALTRIHELSGRLLERGGLRQLLQEIMDAAVEIAGAERGTLQVLEGDSLRIVAHHNHQKPFLEFFESAENVASVCGEATRRGERVIVPDIEESPLFIGTPSLLVLRNAGVRAVQSTPMRTRTGVLLGIVTTQWSLPYSPDEHSLWHLDLLARQAAELIEHARAEEALRAREAELELILNRTPFMLTRCSRDLNYRYVSRAYARMIGRTPDEVAGRPIVEIMGKKGFETIRPYVEAVLRGETVEYEAEVDFEGVGSRLLSLIYVPDRDGPEVIGWIASIRDVTELKRAEQERTRLASFPILDPNPIIETDMEGNVLFVNPSAQKLFPDLQKRGTEHPFVADRESLESTRFDLGNPTRRDVVVGERWYNQTIHFLDGAERIRIYGLDITARKRAERLNQAVADLDEAIHSSLSSGEIMNMALRKAREAIGCETAAVSLREGDQWLVSQVLGFPESLIGSYMSDAEEPHAALAIRTRKAVAIEDASSDSRVNREHMRKWGVRSVMVVPLIIKDDPIGVMFLNYHQKAAVFGSAELNFAERLSSSLSLALENSRLFESLEEKVQERTKELATRADQLRALAGELTLTEQRERRRLANILHDHLQQLLVGAKFGITALSRTGDGLQRQATKELEEVIDEAIASSRSLTSELSPPILHDAGLNAALQWLARRMADKQDLVVDLDAEQIGPLPDDLTILLFESVRELLFNVVKHARAHSARVNLRLVDESLRLTVSDQGIGFDPDAMSPAGGFGGGFGLFSIRERVGLFGGKLEIESTPGRGTRMVISVPLTRQAPVESQRTMVQRLPKESAHERTVAPVLDGKIRILLADDHAVVRQGIANMLSDEPDMEIVGLAADGRQAVDLAEKLLPDVILMDLSMPGLSGADATRIIHGKHPRICIIGLSMFEEAEKAQAMRDAGAANYLTKSGPAEELIDAIRTSVRCSKKSLSASAGS
jgi:PAS domain S-box-containing protein